MTPEIVFSILVSPNCPDLKRVSPSTAIQYDFGTCAALCARIPTRYLNAALLKFARDDSKIKDLGYQLHAEASRIAVQEGWIIPVGSERLKKYSELALCEMLSPKNFRADEIKSAAMGVTMHSWKKYIKRQYEAIYGELDNWCSIAYDSVSKQLKIAS